MAQTKNINEIGRRKTASARVTLIINEGKEEPTFVVNGLSVEKYFPAPSQRDVAVSPLILTSKTETYSVKANVAGGGKSGQAGAIRLGIARALQTQEPELRPALKAAGYLTRDPRAVERKKAGKHKARKSTQFSKR